MHHVNYQLITTLVAVVMALMVIFIRLRASRKPTSAKKILMPPIGMSTGFLMFVSPRMHISLEYAALAFLVGLLFAYPLVVSSKMFVDGTEIYLKRSKGFIIVLLVLLVIRIALHGYIEKFVTIPQTGAIFFILAFGMLLPWRVVMYVQFLKLKRSVETPALSRANEIR